MDTQTQRERVIRYLQWMYEDFRIRRKWDHTPFWRGCRELFLTIAPDDGDDAFLHTQLIPFDYADTQPPIHLAEKLHSEFNVLPMTIEAIQPDVVIFLTGHTLEYNSIGRFKKEQFARISHKLLPFHSYRTYHPGYSLLNRERVFNPIKEKLKVILTND